MSLETAPTQGREAEKECQSWTNQGNPTPEKKETRPKVIRNLAPGADMSQKTAPALSRAPLKESPAWTNQETLNLNLAAVGALNLT